jgi:hypothetical protein
MHRIASKRDDAVSAGSPGLTVQRPVPAKPVTVHSQTSRTGRSACGPHTNGPVLSRPYSAGIMRFSLPHDPDGRPCLPTRSQPRWPNSPTPIPANSNTTKPRTCRPTSPPSPTCERPVAPATRWPASWAWPPPAVLAGARFIRAGERSGAPRALVRDGDTGPSLRPDTCLPVAPWTIPNREHRGSERKPRGDLEGFVNARDLGGLPTRDARVTDRGALLLWSADPRFVTEAGWRAADHTGVRTVIDLRCGECRGRRSSSSFTP